MSTSKVASFIAGDRKIVILRGQFWATRSSVAVGLSLDALKDFLPMDRSLDVKTVRYDTLKVAKRLEEELGEEPASFIEGEPSD